MEIYRSCLDCRHCIDFMCFQPDRDRPERVNNGCCEHWWPRNFNDNGEYEPPNQPEPKTIHTYKQIKTIMEFFNPTLFEEKVNQKLKEDWELVDFKVNDKFLFAIVSKEFEEEI